MAKKTRKNHTGAGAIAALLGAIDIVAKSEKAKVNGDLTEEQQADAVNTAMDAVTQATAVIGDSNVVTALELQDDAIEAMHDADDAAEEEAEQAEQADDADGDAE
jgi:hypothetical protein